MSCACPRQGRPDAAADRATTNALVKLAVSAARHFRIIASINAGDVVALHLPQVVHGEIARKRHGQVVAQRQEFAALIGQIVDQLRIFAVLSRQRLLCIVRRARGVSCGRRCAHGPTDRRAFNSNTGVLMVTAPWCLKVATMTPNTCSRTAIWKGS